jgi:phage tail-like protein
MKAYNFGVTFIPDFGGGMAGKVVGAAVGALANMVVGGFMSVKGMAWETDVRTVTAGGVNDRVYKLPGRTVCKELVFQKGVTLLDPMWSWYNQTRTGHVQRMTGMIYLISDAHANANAGSIPLPTLPTTFTQWHFTRAWPTAFEGVQLDASNNLLAMQSMTLAVESITKIDPLSLVTSIL